MYILKISKALKEKSSPFNQCRIKFVTVKKFFTCFKNKIENNLVWKGAFIKVNELKLTQIHLLYFFHIMCVAANAFELFGMTHLANIESVLYHSKLLF